MTESLMPLPAMAQTPTIEPCQGALDDPAARQNHKAFAR